MYFFFAPKRQLPVVDSLIVGIPIQPPASHAVFSRQLVDRSCPAIDPRIAILVHVLSLNDLLGSVAA